MLLIDASNITVGGGKVLLDYLLNCLEQKKIVSIALCKKDIYQSKIDQFVSIIFLEAGTPMTRGRTLKKIFRQYQVTTLLCFGNYPPPFRATCSVYTYFHNPYLLESPWLHWRKDPLILLKDIYLRITARNTNIFIVQTPSMKEKILKKFKNINEEQCKIWPVYDDAYIRSFNTFSDKIPRFIFVSYPYVHKNHRLLLKAWELLADKHIFPELWLTIPEIASNRNLLHDILRINAKGGRIYNMGSVSHEKALRETNLSKYIIYPSVNETFGLGLIEGALLNCYVIASNLQFVREVIRPSAIFNPYRAVEIAACVQQILDQQDIEKAQVLTQNQVENLIHALSH